MSTLSFVAGFVSLAVGLLSCDGDSDGGRARGACGHAPAALFGGWRAGGSQRACFAKDGRMWIGDSTAEITGDSFCNTSADTCNFECTDPDEGSPFGGTVRISSDQLVLEITDCPASSESCVATYTRDPSVECE